MKRIVLILLTALAFSCAERELQLPVTTANDITEILDVSPIYIFYDEATDSVDFNRKNMISTTNWLVNIDKRLTLKQILPHLQYLQEKRRGDGMHKNENAKNYFTCFNEDAKSLSFIEFTETIFDNELSIKDSLISKYKHFEENSQIEIFMNNIEKVSIYVNSKNIVKFSNFQNFEKDLDSIIRVNDFKKKVYFEYSVDISFQDYISLKSKLLNFRNNNIEIMDTEFIHN